MVSPVKRENEVSESILSLAETTLRSKLTRVDVLPVGEAEGIANDTLRGHEVVPSTLNLVALPPGPSHRPDSVGITESHDGVTSNHTSAGVGSRSSLHDLAHSAEDVVGVDAELASLLQGVGEEVEEELRVGGGVDVTVSVVVEVVTEVLGVGEVSVLLLCRAKPRFSAGTRDGARK